MLPMTYYSGSQFSTYPNGGAGGNNVARDEYYFRGSSQQINFAGGPQAPRQLEQAPYVPPADYSIPAAMMYQDPPDAVECRGLMKSYGRGKGKTRALNNVNMNVEQGSIYGLLGPSGCGKTTLLSCIVGRLRCDAGSIRVFGQKPGGKDSGVPGSLVGYMPQEIALYAQFTIEETLRYFGRIHGMPMSDIKHRTNFLIRFLGLPHTSRMVENLSGGQQRRVSLACALLQKPRLLILDEPTVGVDPLLRYSIWCHLVNLARDEGTSIVITTHYIEEARQANRVGLMRNGSLLAQASPESLLIAHRLPTLEDVFLKLCQSVEGLKQTGPDAGGSSPGGRSGDQPVGFLAAQRAKQLEYAQAHDNLRRGGGGSNMSQMSDSWGLVDARDRSSSGGSSGSTTLHPPAATSTGPRPNGRGPTGRSNKGADVDDAYENPIFTLTKGSGGGGGGSSGSEHYASGADLKRYRRRENMVNGASRLDGKGGGVGEAAGGQQPSTLSQIVGLFHGGGDVRPVKTRTRRGRSYVPTWTTMRALLIKNFISMFRHTGALVFEIFLPAFQIVLFCLTLNSDPQNLGLAVFSEEVNYTSPHNASCDSLTFTCSLIDHFRSPVLAPTYYPTLEDATAAGLAGEAWAIIHVKKNFSSAVIDRAIYGVDATNETLEESRVTVRLDMTNQQVAFIIKREMIEGFQKFFEETLTESGYNPLLAALPVKFGKPIFGVEKPLYTEFVAPGILVMITFFMALGLTAMAFVLERKQGLIYRSYVAGVKNVEVLICYMTTQVVVLVIQIVLTLVVMLAGFQVPNRGSVMIISLLCFVQGICGMSFGLLISSLFNDETSTIVACLGVFLPCLLLSGMCWPREGMHWVLNYVSMVLPQTFGTDALRAVMSKGVGFSNYYVYMGLIVPNIWTVLQMLLTALATHLREGF